MSGAGVLRGQTTILSPLNVNSSMHISPADAAATLELETPADAPATDTGGVVWRNAGTVVWRLDNNRTASQSLTLTDTNQTASLVIEQAAQMSLRRT